MAVLEYKSKGGYIDGKKGNRYLPEHIRNQLTDKQKKQENAKKRKATRDGKQYAKYTPAVSKLMRQ